MNRIVVSDTDPSVSLAEVASLEDARGKKETNFTIVTRNSDGEQCYQEKDVTKGNIKSRRQEKIKGTEKASPIHTLFQR